MRYARHSSRRSSTCAFNSRVSLDEYYEDIKYECYECYANIAQRMHGHYPATKRRAFPVVARAFRAREESEPAIIIPFADKRKPPAIFHNDVFISRLVA